MSVTPRLPATGSARTAGLSDPKRTLLAQRIARAAAVTADPATATATVGPRPTDAPPVLSSAQERLWFMEQFAPGTAAYVVPLALLLPTAPAPAHLDAALRTVTARHDALRMRFPARDDGRPAVEIADAVPVPLRVVDVTDAEEARDRAGAATAEPFDLGHAPLLRALLLRLPDGAAVLHLAVHHIVFDGWSADLLARELTALLAGEPMPPTARVGYADYAHWQQERPAHARDLAYWRSALAGVAPLDLPTDRPRPAEQGFAGADHTFTLDAGLTEALRRLGRGHRATLYMTLLAGWQALLGRYSGQDDFAVGSPVAGRLRPELEDVVGPFVNMLTLRADLAGDPTFAGLLERTRDTAVDALAHQEVPFEQVVQDLVVDRDVSRSPLFQVTFALQNYAGAAGPAGAGPRTFALDLRATRFDLALYATEHADGVGCALVYRTDLFDPDTVDRLAGHFVTLLRAVVAAPGAALSTVDLLGPGERDRLLALGTGAAPPPHPATTLDALLSAAAGSTPRAPAVVAGGDSLTYRELDRAANRLARHLRGLGVGPDVPVAVCLEPSAQVAVALLGVLRAGGAYVPIDPEQPPGRVAAILADAAPAVLVTVNGVLAGLPVTAVPTVCLDRDRRAIDRQRPHRPDGPAATPDHLAYVIYTSGSTGRPKGVAVAHRQVLTYLAGVGQRLRIGAGERFALPQSLAFDFAVTMFYLALSSGGCVHLVPRRCSGVELARYLRTHRIDHLKMTPSHLAALTADVDRPADLAPRRTLLLGGEASRADWAARYGADGAAVINHYGPTEATVGVSTHHVTDTSGPGNTPIGRPLPGARCYVLDARLRPAPAGVPGEIWLAGDRLARGYVGQPALTARSFRPDPYADTPGARMYRTGDLGRWRADGELEFLGRRDHQVKIRGYRVELGEVEASLAGCPGVAQAVTEVRDDRLVAWLERSGAAEDLTGPELRRLLLKTVPEYMVPARYVWLDRLPLQQHGKVDRRALPDPGAATGAEAQYVEPAAGTERTIADIWARVLDVARVGAFDDFFDLGGHSLLATQVVALLRRALPDLPRPVSVMDTFRYRTVRALAAAAEGTTGGSDGLLHELTRPVRGTPVQSLVCVPYGGASAVVYQPLADALPPRHALYAVAVPGHDIGLAEEPEPIGDVAARCAQEILSTVEGPLVLYGHCGPGGALTVEIARRLEAAGRTVDAVYLGGIFPFARPVGMLLGRMARFRPLERFRSDRVYANWLQAMGADVGALDDDQVTFLVRTMRHDAEEALEYFTDLLHRKVTPLRAPIVSVVGERDPGTDFYEERYREWHYLSPVTALVVLDEGGHYFLKYRAEELATIVTGTHRDLEAAVPARADGDTWWLHAVSAGDAEVSISTGVTVADADVASASGPQPSMKRFLAVAAGQTASIVGSSFTEFAIPLWILLQTGSVAKFALLAVLGLVPGMLVAPFAGVIVDRYSRRAVMIVADLASGVGELALAILLWTGRLHEGAAYGLIAWLSLTLMFQRLAYNSAIPQLVPKRYLGHANGVFQLTGGIMVFLVPLTAAGLLAGIGLEGILAIDVVSYAVAAAVVACVRFPRTMAFRRRESFAAEIRGGLRYSVGQRNFRGMLSYFMVLNVFLSPMLLMISPLLLSFADLHTVVRVSISSGCAAVLAGLTLTVWGGPRRRRMGGILVVSAAIAGAGALTGLRGSVLVVGAGATALTFCLVLLNGVYATIIQTKVPQRFHGRVIALNTVAAWCTLPLGWAVVAPFGTRLFEPLMAPGGALAGSAGALLGTGPGRGIALMYLVLAAGMLVLVAVAGRITLVRRFDRDVPDAPPDDLVGLQTLRERAAAAARTAPTRTAAPRSKEISV
jgi:amino acid adenylation domain-containing protein